MDLLFWGGDGSFTLTTAFLIGFDDEFWLDCCCAGAGWGAGAGGGG